MARIVDCDSHVEECDATWEYMDEKYRHRRPIAITLDENLIDRIGPQNAHWMIEHQIFPKLSGHKTTIAGTPTTSKFARSKAFRVGSQTLERIEERLEDIDRMGVDVQVIFPSIFLEALSPDVQYEANLMRSYHTWLSKVCASTGGRLRFAAVLPTRDVKLAVEELRAAHDMGAVCANVFGTAGEFLLHSEHLDPLWQTAVDLDLPVTVHSGFSHPGLTWSCTDMFAADVLSFTLTVFMAFHSFVGAGIMDRFPALRVAFLEAGSDWVPYMIQRVEHYWHVFKDIWGISIRSQRNPRDILTGGNVYFTCEGDEQLLPTVIELMGADHIMISGDVPHAELRENSIEEIKERTDLNDTEKEWILGKTAEEFYKL